jgi:hypothetical protein
VNSRDVRERRGTWCSSPLQAAWATSGLVGCEGSTLAGEARAEGRKAELEEGKKISKDGGPPLPSRVIPVTNPAAFQCLLHYRTDIRTLSSRSLSIHFPLGVSQTRRKPYTLSRIIYNSGTLARFIFVRRRRCGNRRDNNLTHFFLQGKMSTSRTPIVFPPALHTACRQPNTRCSLLPTKAARLSCAGLPTNPISLRSKLLRCCDLARLSVHSIGASTKTRSSWKNGAKPAAIHGKQGREEGDSTGAGQCWRRACLTKCGGPVRTRLSLITDAATAASILYYAWHASAIGAR